MISKPKVLCVDDEPQVLEGLNLHLRQHYEVTTATSGEAGLAHLQLTPDVAVVLSDMRMPGMDGATFLSRAHALAPDTVRMLLTGYADTQSAIAAVNHGQIFRFISKPCPPDQLLGAFSAAATQHNLIVAEKVLLQRTLLGCIDAWGNVLALVNPIAFGRGARLKAKARFVARGLGLGDHWEIEAAAVLSQLGCVTLSEDTMMKVFEGLSLDDAERRELAQSVGTSIKLLEPIPRLEPVIEILSYLRATTARPSARPPAEPSLGARLLRILMELDAFETQGLTRAGALEKLNEGADAQGSELLERVSSILLSGESRQTRSTVAVTDLQAGMVLADDIKRRDGVVVVPRGFEISAAILEHIRAFEGVLAVEVVTVTAKSRRADAADAA
jgi:CheY-like chemotaxis protein